MTCSPFSFSICDLEGFAEVVAKLVDSADLVRFAVWVPRVEGYAVVCSGELVELGALEADVAEAEGVVDLAVDVDGHPDVCLCLLVGSVGGVTLVPEELAPPVEWASRLGLVAVDVAGLVHA